MTTGRFEVVRLLGRGGMAQVFEAVAVGEGGLRRRVAIKRILPRLALDPDVQRMFFDEARIAGHFHHGSIVQVLDFGVLDGGQFIAMEFVDGLDAREATDRGREVGIPTPETVALHVVCAVADALRYVHGLRGDDGEPLGVVHRDVTPRNVLLSWEGDVKLSDFGIALDRSRARHTAQGIVRGKMPFLSPEMLRGEPPTAAADVWALGATLHALVAGDPPGGPTPDLAKVASGAPVPIDPSLSPDVAYLVSRCTSPRAAARPVADEVAAMAGRLLATRHVGDGRGALRGWLDALRAAGVRPAPVDDLLGMVIEPGDTERSFRVSFTDGAADAVRATALGLSQPPAGAEPAPAPNVAPDEPPEAPPPTRAAVSVQAPEHALAEVAAIAERARSDEPQRTSVREDSERGRKPEEAVRSAVLAAKHGPERVRAGAATAPAAALPAPPPRRPAFTLAPRLGAAPTGLATLQVAAFPPPTAPASGHRGPPTAPPPAPEAAPPAPAPVPPRRRRRVAAVIAAALLAAVAVAAVAVAAAVVARHPAPSLIAAADPGAPAAGPAVPSPSPSAGPSTDTTTNGILDDHDPRLSSDASPYDAYPVPVPLGGARLVASMSSRDFDPYLFVLDAAGAVVARNDDAYPGTLDARLDVVLPAGDYRVLANSFRPEGRGAYSLHLMLAPTPAPAP